MDPHLRAELVQRYIDGPDAVDAVLQNVSEQDLDRHPDGEWSARQIVHHLADSEMRSALRVRQLLSEDQPVIQGYDAGAYAEALHYDRPTAASLEAFRASRCATSDLLARLTEEQWARTGTHTEDGAYGVEIWLEVYAAHAHEHAEQIRIALVS